MADIPTIPEFYSGKSVFITGGTGFIGKVLIEKLLRSCPDIKSLYLLMRPKKEKTIEERIKAITDLPLFDVIREKNPEYFKKIKLVSGDVTQLGLGLCDDDRQILIKEVGVVFHGAASVRFDDPLGEAVIMNTRGTRETVKLALEMRQLEVFLYISTTYCQTDRKIIEEKMYPPHADWRKTIELAEKADTRTLNVLTKKYMGSLPNTYTFSKSLAEHVANDLCRGKIPLIIVRPSIVISTVRDPFEGWVDNFNGPIGILTASGKGIVRCMYADSQIEADYVPVDFVVKGLITACWKKAVLDHPDERRETSVYNFSNNSFQTMTFRQVTDLGIDLSWENPLNDILWYPGGAATSCWYYFFIKFIFYQLLPAVLIDTLLKVMGYKPMLVKIQRKIYTANMALEYFITNEWKFINTKGENLELELLPKDREAFALYKDEVDVLEYFTNAMIGLKKYLLKEFDDKGAKKHARRMWIISKVYNVLWYLVLGWFIFYKIDILSIIAAKYNDAYIYLTTE